MTKAELFRLSDEDALDSLWQDAVHHVGLFDLAFGAQRGLQFLVAVEMVLNRPLVAPRHKDQRVDPCRDGFFGRILDERLVDDR